MRKVELVDNLLNKIFYPNSDTSRVLKLSTLVNVELIVTAQFFISETSSSSSSLYLLRDV